MTVCQVHAAVAALIPSWCLGVSPPAALIERTAAILQRKQRRNAASRVSHIKRARRQLRERGIKLTELKRCQWGRT